MWISKKPFSPGVLRNAITAIFKYVMEILHVSFFFNRVKINSRVWKWRKIRLCAMHFSGEHDRVRSNTLRCLSIRNSLLFTKSAANFEITKNYNYIVIRSVFGPDYRIFLDKRTPILPKLTSTLIVPLPALESKVWEIPFLFGFCRAPLH